MPHTKFEEKLTNGFRGYVKLNLVITVSISIILKTYPDLLALVNLLVMKSKH